MIKQYSKPPFLGGFRPVASRGLGINTQAVLGQEIVRGWPVSTNNVNNVAGFPFAFVNSQGKAIFNMPPGYAQDAFHIEADGGILAGVPGEFPSSVDVIVGFDIVTMDNAPPDSLPLSNSGYSWKPGRQVKIWGSVSGDFFTEGTNQTISKVIPANSQSDNVLIDGGGHNPNLPGEGGLILGGLYFQPNGWNPDFTVSGTTSGPYQLAAGQACELFFFFQSLPNDAVHPTWTVVPYLTALRVVTNAGTVNIPLSSIHGGFGAGSAGLPWPPWPGSPGDGYGQPWNAYGPISFTQPAASGGLTAADDGYQDVWLDRLPVPVPSTPPWVTALRAPSGDLPEIVMDFLNNRYWANGFVVGIGDLLYNNSAFGHWNPGSALSPGQGLKFSVANSAWTLTPTYGNPLLSGACILIRANMDPASGANIEVDLCDPTFAIDNFGYMQAGAGSGTTFANLTASTGVTPNITVPALANDAIAYNVLGNVTGTMGISINDSADSTIANTVGATDPTNYAMFISNSATSFCTLVALYRPQPNGDLPAISLLS